MSTRNICFRGEIRKLLCGYPRLSEAMNTKQGLMFWCTTIDVPEIQ